MRRPVVTVDTIHASLFSPVGLFRRKRRVRGDVHSGVAVAILCLNPGNDLSLCVGSNEIDLVAKVHVPVNTTHGPGVGIAATNVHQHANPAPGVVLIVSISIEDLELAAKKLVSPMTMRASVVCRPHVRYGTLDRFVVRSEGDRVELVDAVEFGFQVPSRALADVAVDTLQPCVRRVLKGHELRLHNCVAGLATESY